MPSSFMAKRNYAHCPLKKRPIAALYDEQDEPQDLSVKKPKIEVVEPLRVPKVEVVAAIVPKVEVISPVSSYSTSSAALTPPPASPPPATTSPPSTGYSMAQMYRQHHHPQQHFGVRSSAVPSYPNSAVPSFNLSVQSNVIVNQQFSPVTSTTRHVLPVSAYSLTTPVRQQRTFIPPVMNTFNNSNIRPLVINNITSNNSFKTINNMSVSAPPQPPTTPSLSTSVSVPTRPLSRGFTNSQMPNLADYYLQLFRATSEAETKPGQWIPPNHIGASHMPPSPQASPRSPDQMCLISPTTSMQHYPESSALISPASSVSTISESEDEPLSPTGSVSSTSSSITGSGKARYTCSECGKAYATRPGLAKHKELHCTATLGARAYSCPTCNKSYTSCGALKMHIRTHTLPCKCHVCGKAFSRPWLLQGHIRTHTGEKPFQCSECCRSFADRSNLRAHQQTHASVKKYACVICTKTFSRMSLLNKHREGTCTPGCPSNDNEEEEELDVVGDDDWTHE